MPAKHKEDSAPQATLEPFVLKWAEEAPADWIWSERSVFSGPVNGLDVSMLMESDHVETTGERDTADSTNT